MQKIIFFTPVIETGKLSSIITDDSIEFLKSEGIIPVDSKTLIKDYDETNIKFMYDIYHINFFNFNDAENPTDIVLNKELFSVYVIENFRIKRNQLLASLDALQTRALLSGKTDVVSSIEEDKVKLRNMTDVLDFSNKTNAQDFYFDPPLEITIDYDAKYESMLK